MSSPSARTRTFLEENGWTVAKSEYWNPWSRTRNDLFGIADFVAYRFIVPAIASGTDMSVLSFPYVGRGLAFVQATSAAHVANREAKLRDSPHTWGLLKSGAIVAVIGWSKKGSRGRRKTWCPTVREIRA